MSRFCLFLLLCFSGTQAGFSRDTQKKTLCLNMIVKNEKEVITRCLSSVLPLIDTWVIVDTGSTDGTQEIIKEFLKDIPGTLYERPWVNFGHNRTEALLLAKDKADYLLFMDADDTLSFAPDYKLPELSLDFYACFAKGQEQQTLLPRIVKASIDWKWFGVIHEFIKGTEETCGALLEGVTYVYRHDGARAKDSSSWEKDIVALETATRDFPQDPRNFFYLGKTYLALGKWEEALKAFEKRSQMQGFKEEVFLSKLAMAQIQQVLQKDPKKIQSSFWNACLDRPTRAEGFYYLIEQLLQEGNYEKGFELANLRLESSLEPQDELFVERWIYEFGLLTQHALCSLHTHHYEEGLATCKKLLELSTLPDDYRKKIETCFQDLKVRQVKQIQEKLQQLLLSN